jgi:hypothetical protein
MNPFILMIALMVGGALRASDTAAEAGQPGGFMRAGVGAASGAMGDAYAALAEGPQAVYWNPAALAFGQEAGFSDTYNVLSLGRQADDVEAQWTWDAASNSRVAGEFPKNSRFGMGSWGLGWMGFSLGNDFEGRTSDTPTYFSFGDHQDEMTLAHGRALLPWLAVGAGLKYYDHFLAGYSAHGEGLDLGTLLLLGPHARLALTAGDLFSTFQWSTGYQERFPVTLRGSLAGFFLQDRLVWSAQVENVQGQSPNFGMGFEGVVFRYLKVRAGIQQNGITFGGGTSLPLGSLVCSLDYAWMPDPLELGEEQRISLDLRF